PHCIFAAAHGHHVGEESQPEMDVSGRILSRQDRSSPIIRRIPMNKLPVTLSLVAIGLLFAGGTSVAAGAPKKAATSYECFTDDGYGRRLPCTYGYKLVKSAQT